MDNGYPDQGIHIFSPWWHETLIMLLNLTESPRKLIGYAIYYIGYSTWNGKKFYLEDIMVTEKHRGKGIGKKLFKSVTKVSNILIQERKYHLFNMQLNQYAEKFTRWHNIALSIHEIHSLWNLIFNICDNYVSTSIATNLYRFKGIFIKVCH